MGEAIFGGLLASSEPMVAGIDKHKISVVEPTVSRGAYLQKRYGVTCVSDIGCLPAADVVVLAVKPQVIVNVLTNMQNMPAFENALFISIAAGVTTDTLNQLLPAGARLVRVMPNLPLVVGAGASVVCSSATSTEEDVAWVCKLFACLGSADIISEDEIDIASALSGSGPAYVCALIEALAQAATEQGLSAELAASLAKQTVYGTALQLKETEISPAELREAVSSPGGTTLAALAAMKEAGMQEMYARGIAAAIRRAKELA